MAKQIFLGQSADIKSVLNSARMVAVTNAPVILRGENGSGKELLAEEIHQQSRRSNQSFKSVRCAGLSESSLDSLGQDLSGGTCFFHEVGDLAEAIQTRFLRFLEWDAQHFNVRVIASSAYDLEALVQKETLRADIYYRLNVVPLDLPPLRRRKEDVILLLKQLTKDFARQYGRKAPLYSISARNLIKAYQWPGNLYELRNFCERMVILLPGIEIKAENLPPELHKKPTEQASSGYRLPEEGINLFEFECSLITQALDMAQGNKSKAARFLGLTRDTLLYRMRKYALQEKS